MEKEEIKLIERKEALSLDKDIQNIITANDNWHRHIERKEKFAED